MSEQQVSPAEITSDDKLWALLAYLLTPIVPIIILFLEDKKNRPFLKAHNAQALVLGAVLLVINIALGFIIVGACTGVLSFVYYIFLGIKAYKGETFDIPLVTNFVKKQGWA